MGYIPDVARTLVQGSSCGSIKTFGLLENVMLRTLTSIKHFCKVFSSVVYSCPHTAKSEVASPS